MVAFRKLFPVLAVFGMLIGLTSTANAQATTAPLVCQANAGVPPLVRAEGYTELVGDVVLSCTGGNPAAPFLANFQMFLNTNVTSRLIASSVSEATLLIDEPGTSPTGTPRPFCTAPSPTSSTTGTTNSTNNVVPTIPGSSAGSPCGAFTANSPYQTGTYNTFVANTTSQPNAVVWPGIPVVPPGTNGGTRTIRFTNIRANAAGLGTSNTLIPTQIVAFISVSGSQSFAINNPQQTVAYIQTGLQFSVRNCTSSDVPGSASAFSQCTNFGGNLRTDPTATNDAPFGLRFREGFQSAFKPRIATGQSSSLPGTSYNSESGFVLGSTSNGTVAAPFLGDVQNSPGVASSGTRLAARFANIPAGVRLYVTTTSVAQGTTTASQAQAILVNADPNGAGGTILTSGSTTPLTGITATATLTCAGLRPGTIGGGSGANAVELPVVNGTAVATWEIVGSDPSIIEDAFFLVAVAATANTANNLPGLGTSTVTGNFAPFYAASTGANAASASLPVPRFIDNPISTNDFTISSCQTNLLFPFVTNQAGFDTGIAISNTSRDPFASGSSRLQGGRCTINYYGGTTNGGAAPAAQTTTASVDPGSQLLFVLSSGGNLGMAGTPGFQGYIIAQCNFRYAHGFAFVTDGPIGQARVAEGYLALILDTPLSDSRGTGNSSESLNN